MTEEICINIETTDELIESNSINIVFNIKSSDQVGTYNVSRFQTRLQRVGLSKPSSLNRGQPYRNQHQSLRTRNTGSSSARTEPSDTGNKAMPSGRVFSWWFWWLALGDWQQGKIRFLLQMAELLKGSADQKKEFSVHGRKANWFW